MMIYTSVVFTLLIAVCKVQADDDSCMNLFLPENIKKGCCKDIKEFVFDDEYPKDCKKPSADWTCDDAKCVFKKFQLMSGDEIDYKKISERLDAFTEKNPSSKNMVERVRKQCTKAKLAENMPDDMCDAIKFQVCLYMHSIVECNEWENDSDCDKVAKLSKDCKPTLDKMTGDK